jgi:hypothetical protein
LVKSQVAAQDDRINEQQDRIDRLRTSLEQQMAAADALIAQLEQEATYINSLFQSMQTASQTYK